MNKRFYLILLTGLFLSPCIGQNFSFHSNSPFGIKLMRPDSTRLAQKLMFVDFDNDGDFDILMSGLDFFDNVDPLEWENIHYFLEIQENVGDKWSPQFADRAANFEDFPFPLGYFLPTAGDLNGDAKTDFIINGIVDFAGNRTPIYAKNTSRSLFQFEIIRLDSMELNSFVPESFFIPELIDLDVDGDLDIFMSGFDPAFGEEDGPDEPKYYYAKNTSISPVEPEFLGWFPNPYGLVPNPYVEILTGGDIDNDGDVDLLGPALVIPADSINNIYVHLNTPGPDNKPAFNNVLLSPFGLPTSFGQEQFQSTNLVDIDGDGDQDFFTLFATSEGLSLKFYENELCIIDSTDLSASICEGDAFKLGGNSYTEAGLYTIHLEGSNGCDSIILLTIEIAPHTTVTLNESICDGEEFEIGNEIFTESGDYTVFIVAANGCDSIIELSLEVLPVSSTTINESLCEGESYVLGGVEYTDPGVYSAVLVNHAGCDSTVVLVLDFIVVDNSIVVQDNIITANASNATYQWINCDTGNDIAGANAQTFTAQVTGNYAVRVTDLSGCTALSDCISVVISSTDGDILTNSLLLYPNPSGDIVYLVNNSFHEISHISVTNLAGQVIDQFRFDKNFAADISSLVKGIYVLKIQINGMTITKKLVVI